MAVTQSFKSVSFKIQCLVVALAGTLQVQGQGTFVNLDFESANVSGYPPNSSNVPTNSAIPGWSASYKSKR